MPSTSSNVTASAVDAGQAPARPATPGAAARLRMAALTAVAVYPLITAIVYLVAPLTDGWLPWQRNFLVTPLMVGAMIFVVIPTIQQRFGRFVVTGRWRA